MPERILVCTRAGMSSIRALHELRQTRAYEIEALLAKLAPAGARIDQDRVPRELLLRQAEALRLRAHVIDAPSRRTERIGGEQAEQALLAYRRRGVRGLCSGIVSRADLREELEHLLASLGMYGIFPLWGRDGPELARSFVELGFRAVVTCVDAERLDPSMAGRMLDEGFLGDLPAGVDPNGASGEFRTFVYNGPGFRQPVTFHLGEPREAGRFVFRDLLPV